MLEDLALLFKNGSYTALVIAGDVYDRSIPSAEAVELFGDFLGKLKNIQPSPLALVIPGNHDSASRLGFGRELFARLGIRFTVSAEDCVTPVVAEGDNERCAFFLLPFLLPGAFSGPYCSGTVSGGTGSGESVFIRSQSALAEEAACRLEKARLEWIKKNAANSGSVYSVLTAHLFAGGGTEAGSERVFLGNAELVNTSLFDGFDYIALGHLHRCQSAGTSAGNDHPENKAWYSGSPLSYSFAESGQEKFFLSVELKDGRAVAEKIPVKPKHRVTSLSGEFARFAGDISGDNELLAAVNDYLEIRLTGRGLTENARDILRKRFPLLLSLRQDEALAGLSSAARAAVSGERRSTAEDFNAFLISLYGKAERDEILLFNSLLEETETGESA